MKPQTRLGALLLVLFLLGWGAGCTGPQQNGGGTAEPTLSGAALEMYAADLDPVALAQEIESAPLGELTAVEEADILYLREEEKLARDAYLTFFDTWNLQTFERIARSEQTHTDSVQVLIDRYGLEDPYIEERGVFTNETLQQLHDRLVADGAASLNDALRAAALIEETDIADLQTALDRTDKSDITFVYENLKWGSGNHLRAFVRQLEMRGESYAPQVLTEEEYEEILSTPMTQAPMRMGA